MPEVALRETTLTDGALVLVVAADPELVQAVRRSLVEARFRVATTTSGGAAIDRAREIRPDLILLDQVLPDASGIEICRQIRADRELARTPLISLSSKSEAIDRIEAFEVGADDCVTKPLSPREVTLRVWAVLRRQRWGLVLPSLQVGSLRLERESLRCFHGSRQIALTTMEFRLLEALMLRPGRVLTRNRLMNDVWGSEITVSVRTIDTHLKRVRKKLGSAREAIETVRGVGYRFAEA